MRSIPHVLSVLVLILLQEAAFAQEPAPLEMFLQMGHGDVVGCLALSGDGKYLVTGGGIGDRTAILWRTADGKKLQTFDQHKHHITGVAISRDGKHVVTGSWDDTAILWESASGKILQIYHCAGTPVTSVALSQDGKRVVTGTWGQGAILWDTFSGKRLQTFKEQVDLSIICTGVSLSRNGKHLATGEYLNQTRVWDIATGQKIAAATGSIVALSDDGNLLLTGHFDSWPILWEVDGGKKLRTFAASPSFQHPCSALSSDGKRVLAAANDGKAILFAAGSGEELQTFQAPVVVTSLALSEDGKHAVTGLKDGSAILWETAGGKQVRTFHGEANAIGGLALSGDGKQILAGSRGKAAMLWDAADGKLIQSFQGDKALGCVALSEDGNDVVTGSAGPFNQVIALWQADGGKQLRTFQAKLPPPYFNDVTGLALSGDRKFILSGSLAAAILWDAATGAELRSFPRVANSIITRDSVAMSRDGSLVLAIADNTSAILWDAASGNKLRTIGHGGNITCVALGPSSSSKEGGLVLTGYQDGSAILLKAGPFAEKVEVLHRFGGQFSGYHLKDVCCAAVSRDGKHAVTGSWDKTAKLWDAASGKMLQSFNGHTRKVTSVALSPRFAGKGEADAAKLKGGQHVWTASEDGSVRLWNSATGKERCRLFILNGGKDWLVVTPAGFFNGSVGGRRFMAFRVPGTLTIVDDDATLRRFQRPGLLAQAWKGEL